MRSLEEEDEVEMVESFLDLEDVADEGNLCAIFFGKKIKNDFMKEKNKTSGVNVICGEVVQNRLKKDIEHSKFLIVLCPVRSFPIIYLLSKWYIFNYL